LTAAAAAKCCEQSTVKKKRSAATKHGTHLLFRMMPCSVTSHPDEGTVGPLFHGRLVSLSVKKTKWLDDRFFTFMTDSAAENKSLRATPPQ
jgi:hypothetical protein